MCGGDNEGGRDWRIILFVLGVSVAWRVRSCVADEFEEGEILSAWG